MKILLLDNNGQLGGELQRSLALLGKLIGMNRHSTVHCGDIAFALTLPAWLKGVDRMLMMTASGASPAVHH